MAVLLEILIETVILIVFLWIGKSIMKAQVYFTSLVFTGFAGALASQVPFAGAYLSFAVVLFFMWKMARVDMVPDGVLIVIIGKGAGLILMIFATGLLIDQVKTQKVVSGTGQIPIYRDEEGRRYFADGDQVYYRNEKNEKVFVDANELFGITEMMDIANHETEPNPNGADREPEEDRAIDEAKATELAEVAANEEGSFSTEFSEPLLSDSVVRGLPLPFELFVPRGWMIGRSAGVLEIRKDDHTYFHCYSRDNGSDNKSYLRKEVNRVLSQYAGFEVARQEVISLDGAQWARIQFVNDPGDQVLLFTHANRTGCYTMELNGSFQQLSSNKEILNRIMYSFNFPPTTYFLAQLESEQ